MSTPWTVELWRLAGALAAGFFAGLLFGHSLAFLWLAVLVYLFWHLRNVYRLERWLRKGSSINPPEATGIWGEIFTLLYLDKQKSRKRKRRLATMLSRFQQSTAAIPDATVVIGAHDTIEWFNDAARRRLGLSGSSDVGQRIDNLLRYPEFIGFLERADEDERLQIPSPVDEKITLQLRIVPYGKNQHLLIARDVSQQLRLEQTRRDFVANVSHELRTPLTVVRGYLEIMADSDDECRERWGESLDLMNQQTERMRRLVEDLLLLSKLESGRLADREEKVAVPGLLEAIAKGLHSLASEKAQQVELEIEPGLYLYGDEKELYSAFSNLATNASRYTQQGGHITLRWYRDEAGAHFEVEDTGIGIPPEHIPRLTERFYRVDVGRSRDTGGTGLGLAIVKHVLNRHGATLHIESTSGKGSLFRCDFPPEIVA